MAELQGAMAEGGSAAAQAGAAAAAKAESVAAAKAAAVASSTGGQASAMAGATAQATGGSGSASATATAIASASAAVPLTPTTCGSWCQDPPTFSLQPDIPYAAPLSLCAFLLLSVRNDQSLNFFCLCNNRSLNVDLTVRSGRLNVDLTVSLHSPVARSAPLTTLCAVQVRAPVRVGHTQGRRPRDNLPRVQR